MTLFNDRIRNIDEAISDYYQEIEKLQIEQKKITERNTEVDRALKILENVASEFQHDDEVLFDLKSLLSALFAKPTPSEEPEPTPKPTPKPETTPKPTDTQTDTQTDTTETEPTPELAKPEHSPEPEAIAVHTPGSDLIHRNPSIYWDHHRSLRMFLSTQIDAEQTASQAEKLGIEHTEIYQSGDDFILVLWPVETRELCDQILIKWLEDETEDMAQQEDDQLGEIEPKDNKTWLNETAYIIDGSCTVTIGFKLKKTRDEWAKHFEWTNATCKIEKQEFSYISDCKSENCLITCYDIGETAYGESS